MVRAWVDQYPYQFKFVVSRPEDVEELEHMLAALQRDIPRHKVLLMPEATIAGKNARPRGLAGGTLQGAGLPLRAPSAHRTVWQPTRNLKLPLARAVARDERDRARRIRRSRASCRRNSR